MLIRGRIRLGEKTKALVKELRPKELALILHRDLDSLAANSLVEKDVQGVINCECSITGRYPNEGPLILLQARIPLWDGPRELLHCCVEGEEVTIRDHVLYLREGTSFTLQPITTRVIEEGLEKARANLPFETAKFVDNTVQYIQKEKEFFLKKLEVPELKTSFAGQQVVVVVRGVGYKEDLRAIAAYIEEVRPVLFGVDGGADALLECGYGVDVILGDMDSVSHRALKKARDVVVHSYLDGRSPGSFVCREKKIPFTVLKAMGTSEDVAMLLAYEMGAKVIVAVGTHTHLLDFLEKGRYGMASTFLCRMRIGSCLVDAKGVSKLYTSKRGMIPYPLLLAALAPIFLFVSLSSPWRQFIRLLWLRLRVLLGGM